MLQFRAGGYLLDDLIKMSDALEESINYLAVLHEDDDEPLSIVERDLLSVYDYINNLIDKRK